ICRDIAIDRQILGLNQFEKNLTRRRRTWVDVDEVAVTGIARVMIDVDPNFCRLYGGNGIDSPVLDCSVECDNNVNIFRSSGRFSQQVRAWEKTVFVEHAVLVPNTDILAEFFERKPKGQLAAERVAIGPNMTENDEPPMLAQDLADLLELCRAHAFFSLSLSIC